MVYKLYYFPGRGLAEPTRQLFALAGENYEDIRISFEEWGSNPKHKEETPFGQMPVLDVDGVKIGQSAAVGRFVAKKFGYYGKTDLESAQIDAIVDLFKDFFVEIRPYLPIMFGRVEGNKEETYKTVYIPARDKFFGYLTKILNANKSGFLVGDSVSWADLVVVEHVGIIQMHHPDAVDQYKEVLSLKERVNAIPAIAKWNAERPETLF